MFYSFKRGGKLITGNSIRMAEIVGSTYRNIRAEAMIVEIGHSEVTSVGQAWDLETNFAVRKQYKRKIVDKNGRRYNDDMIVVTCNALNSIALREAIFAVVPRALLKPIEQAAKEVAVGNAKTLSERRQRAVEWFKSVGVEEAAVYAVLGKNGMEEIDLKDLETLFGLKTAIHSGELSVEEAFSIEEQADSSRAESLIAKVKGMKKGGKPEDTKVDPTGKAQTLPTVTEEQAKQTLKEDNKAVPTQPVAS